MFFFLKAVILLIVGIIVVGLVGCLWNTHSTTLSVGKILIEGFFTVGAFVQLLAVPMVFYGVKHHVLVFSFLTGLLIMCTIAVLFNRKQLKKMVQEVCAKKWNIKENNAWIYWLICIVLIFVQVLLVSATYTGHEDDNRYVAEVVDAVETDTMLQYHPFTGEYLGEPKYELLKDAVAPISMLWATLSVIFHIPPAALMHTVIPLFAIPLCYYVYYLIGKKMMKGDSKKTAMFMIVLWLFFMTNHITPQEGTGRLLYYMWWGKSWLVAFFVPLLIFLFLDMMDKEKTTLQDYLKIAVLMVAACLGTSMAPIMLPIIAGIYGLTDAIMKKKIQRLIYPVLSCVPALCFGVLYFMVDRI